MRFTRQVVLRRAWMASHFTFSYFFHILLPKMTMSRLTLVVLRYVALLPPGLRLRPTPILRSARHSLSIIPFAVPPRHVHTARCLSASYPGI